MQHYYSRTNENEVLGAVLGVWVLMLLLMLLGTCGAFVVDDRPAVFADDVDSELLNRIA